MNKKSEKFPGTMVPYWFNAPARKQTAEAVPSAGRQSYGGMLVVCLLRWTRSIAEIFCWRFRVRRSSSQHAARIPPQVGSWVLLRLSLTSLSRSQFLVHHWQAASLYLLVDKYFPRGKCAISAWVKFRSVDKVVLFAAKGQAHLW